MENITVGEILVALALVSNAITQISNIKSKAKEKKEDAFKPIYDKIDDLKQGVTNRIDKIDESHFEKINDLKQEITNRIDKIDESQCKNFLVRYMRDIELGNTVGIEETKRAIEVYRYYSEELHKNGYIHEKWELCLPKIHEIIRKG